MTEEARVVVRPVIPEDRSDLPEGMIGKVVTDEGELVGYIPAEIIKSEEEK